MSGRAGTRQQMPKIRPVAQFAVSLPLRVIPQGSAVSPRTEPGVVSIGDRNDWKNPKGPGHKEQQPV